MGNRKRPFKIPPDLEWESGLYHEAGHAVVSAVLDCRFRYISMRPRSEAGGHVVYPRVGWRNHPLNTGRWQTEAAVDVAGLIAQYLFIQDGLSFNEHDFDDHNDAALRSILTRHSSRDDMKSLRYGCWWAWSLEQIEPGWSATPILSDHKPVDLAVAAWQQAAHLVVSRWCAVCRVATELHESPRAVGWDRVCGIVDDSDVDNVDDIIAEYPKLASLLTPWFLDHSRLAWEPSVAWYESCGSFAHGGQ